MEEKTRADEKRYIDAMPLIAEYDKSIQWLKDNIGMLSMNQFTDQMASMQSARKMLLDAPVADVRPVVRGRCSCVGSKNGRGGIYVCSACNGSYPYKTKFCPNCGADMREVGGNG